MTLPNLQLVRLTVINDIFITILIESVDAFQFLQIASIRLCPCFQFRQSFVSPLRPFPGGIQCVSADLRQHLEQVTAKLKEAGVVKLEQEAVEALWKSTVPGVLDTLHHLLASVGSACCLKERQHSPQT